MHHGDGAWDNRVRRGKCYLYQGLDGNVVNAGCVVEKCFLNPTPELQGNDSGQVHVDPVFISYLWC